MRIYRNMKILISKPSRMGRKTQKYSGGEGIFPYIQLLNK